MSLNAPSHQANSLTPEDRNRARWAALVMIPVLLGVVAQAVREVLRPRSPEEPQPRLVKPDRGADGHEKGEEVILTAEAISKIFEERGYDLKAARQELMRNPEWAQHDVAHIFDAKILAPLTDHFPFRRSTDYQPMAGDEEERSLHLYVLKSDLSIEVVDTIWNQKIKPRSHKFIRILPGALGHQATYAESDGMGDFYSPGKLSSQQQAAILEALKRLQPAPPKKGRPLFQDVPRADIWWPK